MPRSQAVRYEALRLDGERCQVCGANGRTGAVLEVHHVDALGIGGSDERDTVENAITLCGSCHVKIGNGQLFIETWDRQTLEVFDSERRRIQPESLWFYRRKDAEEGEQILSELSRFTMLDKTIAERVHRLGEVVKSADPDARSLRECLASHGLLASQLLSASKLYARSLETQVEWPDGMSVSDYRRMLAMSGHEAKREYFYIVIPARSWLTGARPEVYYRTAYEAELRDTMDIGDRCYKLGKVVWGLRAENGHLIRPDGSEERVIHFAPKEA